MNQYERLFIEEVKEKKIAAAGARHRASRNPKHGGAVRTPSDSLTPKQRKELSGPVTTVTLKPMTWGEFKALTIAEKRLYLKLMQETYAVNSEMMAKVFGTSRATVSKWAKNLDVPFPVPHGKTPDHVAKKRSSFTEWLSTEGGRDVEVPEAKSEIAPADNKDHTVEITEVENPSRIIIEAAGIKITIEK